MVAAAALMTGLTGCGGSSDTNNVSTSTTNAPSAVVNPNEQAKYTAPIQGLVIDDRGQFVVGATVTIGNQHTTTDETGQYSFESVDISSYVINEINQGKTTGDGNGLLVSIKAPAGTDMNDVVVSVSPQMVHVADGSNDPFGDAGAEVTVTGDQNVLANSQSFVINSQVGTAMLVHKAADVKFDLRNPKTGVALPEGTKVVAMYLGSKIGGTSQVDNASMTINDNVITSVNSVVSYVDANGEVFFDNLLTSSAYTFLVEGYNSNNPITTVTKPYAGDEYVMDLGNIYTTPILSGDTRPPLVASVSHDFGVTGPSSQEPDRLMLDNTVTDTIQINFTEPVTADDIANNVKVISNGAFLDVANAEFSDNGMSLIVTLANPLTDGQVFDLMIFRDSRLRDLAGNELAFVNAAAQDGDAQKPFVDLATCVEGCESGQFDYLSCTMGSRAIKFSLMAYKALSEDAEPATGGVQMELNDDVTRTAGSTLSSLEEYSRTFNSVGGVDNLVVQLNNVSGDETLDRLDDLADALVGNDGDVVSVDTAKIKFTAGKATIYQISVPENAGCTTNNANITVTQGGCNGKVDAAGNNVYIVSGFSEGDEISLLVDGVKDGDKVVVTPMNDYCLAGDVSTEIPLHDNVPPTTVLQNSYTGENLIADGIEAIVPFGEGGELTDPDQGDGTLGLPSLYLTPGLLDNLDKDGKDIFGADNITGDETLYQELYVKRAKDNNYSVGATDYDVIYDATAYVDFSDELARTIGVAFSENVDLTGVTPSFGAASVSNYRAANDIKVDDAGHEINRDLVAFDTTNVMTLANNEVYVSGVNGRIMSFDGIKDLAGNAADNAKVKVFDGMPPMVTKAIFDGEKLVITFNEPIVLKDGVSINAAGNQLTYSASTTPATWTLDASETVLTITDITGLDAGDFSEQHKYDESALYGLDTGDYKHAALTTWYIEDKAGNTQMKWYNLDPSKNDMSNATFRDLEGTNADANEIDSFSFAMISAIGDFVVTAYGADFKAGEPEETVLKVKWTFNQPVRISEASDFFHDKTTYEEGTDDAKINAWFTYNGNPLTDEVNEAKITLSSDRKEIVLTFKKPGEAADDDIIEPEDNVHDLFVSDVDPDQAYPLPSVNAVDEQP